MHTEAIRIAYADETNYACGNNSVSTVKYASKPFGAGEAADLTVMNAPYSSSPSLGIPEVERKKLRPIGRGANYVKALDVGYNYKEFTYTHAIQNDTWIQLAVQCAAGAIPASKVFHCEIPGVDGAMDYFDIVGVVLQKYELKMGDGNDWPTETITFLYYDVVDSVAVTDLLEVTDAQPTVKAGISMWVTATEADVAITALEATDLYSDLSVMNLSVENTLIDKKIASKHLRQDPTLKFRDVSGDAEFTTDTVGILGDSIARNGTLTAITLYDIYVQITGTANHLRMAEMYCKTDSIGEIPDTTENIMFKTEFEQGGNCRFVYGAKT